MADDFILSACKYCQHEFRVPSKLAGKQVNCPSCQRQILIAAAAAKPAEDKLVGKEVGGCRLVRRLGAGALGVVYEAEQKSVGRKIALKMLSSRAASQPEVVTRFQREAKLSAAIHHENVVGVFDCGLDRGVHFLVMEYIDGNTLAGLTEDAGRLDWKTAAGYVKQVAQALEYVHGKDIIHRDIKPANILVGTDGVAKLADLGLAKQIDTSDAAGLTMQGMALGSPAYMPPEQIRNARDAGRTADIYSLGASFYQMLSGKLPFEGKNSTEVMTKVLRETPIPLTTAVPDLPKNVSQLVERMMDKDPTKRPKDATALIAEIDALEKKPATVKARRAATGSVSKKSGSNWLIIAVIAFAVAAVVAGVIVMWPKH